MTESTLDSPPPALEEVAYLSRSANRVVILDALTSAPQPRRQLAEGTGTSRTTLDRIVNELEERGWAKRTSNGEYVATPSGRQLMAQFRPFLESVEALRRLGEAVDWLPHDELSIGLEHFSDAVVWEPATDDPVETVEFMKELIAGASRFRVLSHLAPPEPLSSTFHDGVTSGRLVMDGVATDDLLAFINDHPERAARWRDSIRSGTPIYRTAGPIPCNLWIIDETVLIKQSGPGPIDESYGVPIVSDDETVRAWANELIDEWQATGTRVDVDAFATHRSSSDADEESTARDETVGETPDTRP